MVAHPYTDSGSFDNPNPFANLKANTLPFRISYTPTNLASNSAPIWKAISGPIALSHHISNARADRVSNWSTDPITFAMAHCESYTQAYTSADNTRPNSDPFSTTDPRAYSRSIASADSTSNHATIAPSNRVAHPRPNLWPYAVSLANSNTKAIEQTHRAPYPVPNSKPYR
jgi:hypothetical protein